jgi:hypothetical protein
VDSDDDATSDVFLDKSGTGVVPLFALLWVLGLGWMAPVLLSELGNFVGANTVARIT